MNAIRLLVLFLLLPAFAAPMVAATPPPGLQCFVDPSYAEITSLSSSSTTIQVANNTLRTNVSGGQALIFSLDGGFWVDIDHHCLQWLEVSVTKTNAAGVVTRDGHGHSMGCSTGTHSEWVPMGLDVAQVNVEIQWGGCDGRRGGGRGTGTAGDPPVFHHDGSLRL